jgi:hypothetical protein
MRERTDAHLRRYRLLLSLADARGSSAQVIWRSTRLGSWKDVSARWTESAGRIRLGFNAFERGVLRWVSRVQQTSSGLRIFLSDRRKPIPEEFRVVWDGDSEEADPAAGDLWSLSQRWLRERFPGVQVLSARRSTDAARSLSGSFLRIVFRARGFDHIGIVSDPGSVPDSSRSALTQALLFLSTRSREHPAHSVPRVHLLVPSSQSAVLFHRSRFLNAGRVRVEIWEYDGNPGREKIGPAPYPPEPVEERDFRWPVLGPFRWSEPLAKVLDLAPEFIRRYPRFQDYDSLRLQGLEFARAMGPDRDRLCFGVGTHKVELEENSFPALRAMIDEILFYRRADSPDTRHPYYRLQAERWLETLILEHVDELFPELSPESVYPQIPVYLGKEAGRVDILAADRCGNLVVMELKVSEDPNLPVQALDYWGRVIGHNLNGDFEKRGYFSRTRLSREPPTVYLVSPVFSFHDSTERLLAFLDPNLEVWKVAVNEDWRSGVRILGRLRLRCGDLT